MHSTFFFISILTASFSEETFKNDFTTRKKKKRKRTKITEDPEYASAKRNIVLQPAINFGHHSGFLNAPADLDMDMPIQD